MNGHALFDSTSGDHIEKVLRRIEQRNASRTHEEADSEFLRGERSVIAEIRQILAAATDLPAGVADRLVAPPAQQAPENASARHSARRTS